MHPVSLRNFQSRFSMGCRRSTFNADRLSFAEFAFQIWQCYRKPRLGWSQLQAQMQKVGEIHQRQPAFQLPKGHLWYAVNTWRIMTIGEIVTCHMSSRKVSCLCEDVGIAQWNINETVVCKNWHRGKSSGFVACSQASGWKEQTSVFSCELSISPELTSCVPECLCGTAWSRESVVNKETQRTCHWAGMFP